MASGDDYNFELGEKIEDGSYGNVYLCYDRNDGDKKIGYALKVIDLTKSTEDERERAEQEASLLKDLQHEFILRTVTSYHEKGALCIVTEFCDQGNLSEFLERRNDNFLDELRIVEWFRQICSALKYLHGRHILHRDVATSSVYLTGEDMKFKLGDFEFVKVVEGPITEIIPHP
ncbi:uncharacterized protein LOC134250433 [Saccostrea cucullata]|uniref:uncharacterized protein LOC134250433 n=1 Tax=Saccostrea cuccullata TaxID=36930 RepID=UPI002ED4589B